MKVEVTGDPLPDEALEVTRRIFTSLGGQTVARVVLTPPSGGFFSKNYSVESFDAGGRRLLPSVLKLGGHDLIRRELEAYEGYVKPFVLNNSTAVLGTARCGEWSGLAYNFLGVTGSQAKLTWLTNLYKERPAEDLLPLYDRIFTDVLKPWYGQPRWEPFQPYKAHDPAPALFLAGQGCGQGVGRGPRLPHHALPRTGPGHPQPIPFPGEPVERPAGRLPALVYLRDPQRPEHAEYSGGREGETPTSSTSRRPGSATRWPTSPGWSPSFCWR